MKRMILWGMAGLAMLLASGYWLLPEEEVSRLERAVGLEAEHPDIELIVETIAFNDGSRATLNVASGFSVQVAAEGLGKARFMAFSPDGRLFVPDLVDYNLSREGRLLILDDWNEETGRFETTHTYLSGLRGPNSIAFYRDDSGQDWLYLALTEHLVRYPYKAGDNEPSREPEVIATFPNEQSPGEVSVVWHITRTILFHDDRLYVSVGSGCNACEELAGDMRAMIYSMEPDGSDERVEGRGLRNTVGIEFAKGDLYATGNGVDHLGEDTPDETLYQIKDGQHYGWPYCYVKDGQNIADQSQSWNNPIDCGKVPIPLTTFAPRSAPLGLRYFDSKSHSVLADSFLVALHGSFVASVGSGNEIRRVTREGEQQVFMSGFIQDGERIIRPVDFIQNDNDSFFFTDDHGGRVFYVKAK